MLVWCGGGDGSGGALWGTKKRFKKSNREMREGEFCESIFDCGN